VRQGGDALPRERASRSGRGGALESAQRSLVSSMTWWSLSRSSTVSLGLPSADERRCTVLMLERSCAMLARATDACAANAPLLPASPPDPPNPPPPPPPLRFPKPSLQEGGALASVTGQAAKGAMCEGSAIPAEAGPVFRRQPGGGCIRGDSPPAGRRPPGPPQCGPRAAGGTLAHATRRPCQTGCVANGPAAHRLESAKDMLPCAGAALPLALARGRPLPR